MPAHVTGPTSGVVLNHPAAGGLMIAFAFLAPLCTAAQVDAADLTGIVLPSGIVPPSTGRHIQVLLVGLASGQERADPAQEERRRIEQELANERRQIEREPGPVQGEPERREGDRRILTDGRTLADRIRAGDKRLILPINQSLGNPVLPPAGVSQERFWLDLVSLVAVIRVQSAQSHLVYRDDMDAAALDGDPSKLTWKNVPAGEDKANWVATEVRARIETVVKSTGVYGVLNEGDTVVFYDDGGTTTVRGAEVVALVPWHRPLLAGKRYLVFGIIGGGKLVRTAMYEEPAPFASLVSVGPQGDGTLLETLNIEQAIAHLQIEMAK